jgi:hypothetical protein
MLFKLFDSTHLRKFGHTGLQLLLLCQRIGKWAGLGQLMDIREYGQNMGSNCVTAPIMLACGSLNL